MLTDVILHWRHTNDGTTRPGARRARMVAWLSGAIVAVALLAALVSGCGSAGSLDPVAQAAQTTGGMPGADFSIVAGVSVPGLSQPIAFRGTGTEDMRARKAELTADLAPLLAAAHQHVGNPSDAKLTAVFAYPWIYLSAPILVHKLPGGKQWIGINLVQVARRQGVNLGQLAQFNQDDPSQYLQSLRATSGDVHKLGSALVRGVRTTHYRALVDLRKLPKLVPAAQRASAQQSADRLAKLTGSSTYPVEAWVDARHVVRRIHVVISTRSTGPGAPPASFSETVEFYNFGPKPGITAPPAGEVLDLGKLAGRQPQSSSSQSGA